MSECALQLQSLNFYNLAVLIRRKADSDAQKRWIPRPRTLSGGLSSVNLTVLSAENTEHTFGTRTTHTQLSHTRFETSPCVYHFCRDRRTDLFLTPRTLVVLILQQPWILVLGLIQVHLEARARNFPRDLGALVSGGFICCSFCAWHCRADSHRHY